ncbi:hypothetical protein KAI04_04205 [Candidatus Pacearchaeota archaeon]|nr:hypothetical protein [Candidatus Pacearchaeota archaeon]
MKIIPIIILGILSCISLGISMEKHGNYKTGKENAWIGILSLIFWWGMLLWIISP